MSDPSPIGNLYINITNKNNLVSFDTKICNLLVCLVTQDKSKLGSVDSIKFDPKMLKIRDRSILGLYRVEFSTEHNVATL